MRSEFRKLEQKIIQCRKCPRLVEWREKIAREKTRRFKSQEYWGRPVPAFGRPDAELVIIGLAPAAHGGNRTGRVFTGDRSGDWLYDALYQYGFANRPASIGLDDGLAMDNCLITAVVRCAPPDNKPLPEEVNACREYLRLELKLAIRKRVVVALGRIAFDAFIKIWRADGKRSLFPKPAFRHGGGWRLSEGLILISSYHPSQQNTQTGKLTRPMFHQIFALARNIISGN
ncbi:MAG: uracil-DNA glycosylase [Acidobacteria bacterium]|nr:uracil-DNA glycosylase [Acidobacteriota bacterium]